MIKKNEKEQIIISSEQQHQVLESTQERATFSG